AGTAAAHDRSDQLEPHPRRVSGASPVERERSRLPHPLRLGAGRAAQQRTPQRERKEARGERLIETLAAGRYPIDRVLGHGGMASVYLARDEELHRPVAIKILAEHLLGDEGFRARFVREARLSSKLSHPNVVQVFDAGDDAGRPYIVMEYVPGRTIAKLGKLDPDTGAPPPLHA